MMYDFDILTIGGGLVACALAQALSNTPLKIGLCDSTSPDLKMQAEPDLRSLAISYRSQLLLNQLNVWSHLSEAITPITEVHVSDEGRWGMTRIDARREKVPALGYVLEISHLMRGFIAALSTNTSCQFLAPAQVTQISKIKQGYELTVNYQGRVQTWKTRLLVIATGIQSTLLQSLNIAVQSHAYQQSAIVLNVGFDRALSGRAYERFTSQGPIACLPLRARSASIVWTMSAGEIQAYQALSDSDFKAALQRVLGYRVGLIQWLGQRQIFPLTLQIAREQIRDRLVILGNAAHQLHPVAGQGFNLSLRDVISLSDEIKQAIKRGEDFATYAVLENYIKRVAPDQRRMIDYTHGLIKSFSNTQPVLALLRNAALLSLDLLPIVKHRLAQHNMGF